MCGYFFCHFEGGTTEKSFNQETAFSFCLLAFEMMFCFVLFLMPFHPDVAERLVLWMLADLIFWVLLAAAVVVGAIVFRHPLLF